MAQDIRQEVAALRQDLERLCADKAAQFPRYSKELAESRSRLERIERHLTLNKEIPA